jgi:hypothetical protein
MNVLLESNENEITLNLKDKANKIVFNMYKVIMYYWITI